MSWRNTEKYKTFSVLIKTEVIKFVKDSKSCNYTYKIKLIDSTTFIARTLSNLVDNPVEGIHKFKCKDFEFFVECGNVNDNLI